MKYQNFAQFLDGISEISEDLSDGERLVLLGLAIRADWKTARSRPGTSALAKRSGRNERSVRRLLEKLWRERALLDRMSKGDGGRGIATVWEIRVEDPRFPPPKLRPKIDQDIYIKPGHDSVRVYRQRNPDIAGNKPGQVEPETRTGRTANPDTAMSTLPISPSLSPSSIPSKPNTSAETVSLASHHRFSTNTAKTDENLPSRDLKSLTAKMETAREILRSKGYTGNGRGWMADIAMMRVADLAEAKDSVPRTVAYFITSVERALEDPHECQAIENILQQRLDNGIAHDAPLEAHEKHNGSKIVLVRSVVEEAARLGRPATEMMAERLKEITPNNKRDEPDH